MMSFLKWKLSLSCFSVPLILFFVLFYFFFLPHFWRCSETFLLPLFFILPLFFFTNSWKNLSMLANLLLAEYSIGADLRGRCKHLHDQSFAIFFSFILKFKKWRPWKLFEKLLYSARGPPRRFAVPYLCLMVSPPLLEMWRFISCFLLSLYLFSSP